MDDPDIDAAQPVVVQRDVLHPGIAGKCFALPNAAINPQPKKRSNAGNGKLRLQLWG